MYKGSFLVCEENRMQMHKSGLILGAASQQGKCQKVMEYNCLQTAV